MCHSEQLGVYWNNLQNELWGATNRVDPPGKGDLLHELGLQQDNLGKTEVTSLWLRLWHILCVIYVLDCPTHLETTKLISIPKGTEKSYLQGLSEWLVKAIYSLYIEISISMSKPNDFLGLLYVTFDYLCQLLNLFHIYKHKHRFFTNVILVGNPYQRP